MMFSTKTLLAVTLLALNSGVAQSTGADCWSGPGCGHGGALVLTRSNGCTLPPSGDYPLDTTEYPVSYVMGAPAHFCGNRKSGLTGRAAELEAIEYCFEIGADSACIWGECGPDVPCYGSPPSTWGDPHFRTWAGEGYDFHGVCDLVFLESPSHNLTVHIRTTQKFHYSYVSSAAVSLNGQVMEFGSWGTVSQDGVYDADDSELPATFGGMPLTLEVSDKKTHTYMVALEDKSYLEVKSYKDMVGVKVIGDKKQYEDSYGVMGSAKTGEKLGRDGVTVFEDNNLFGQEWQVTEDEPKLFDAVREPQAPARCMIPERPASEGRRLGEAMAREEAEEACSKWHMNKEACISDVMATGDKEMAANVY